VRRVIQLTENEGRILVELALRAIRSKLGEDQINLDEIRDPPLNERGMAFVTVDTMTEGKRELRGCIGYVEPVAPLKEVVVNAAIAAAFQDPRFPPLAASELERIVVEVTVLSEPVKIEVQDRWTLPFQVKIGEDGLIVQRGIRSGLLLPQVPVEYCWDEETFLAETCLKAGLAPDCWLDDRVTVKKFKGKIFRQKRPGDLTVEVLVNKANCGQN
jgi:uncharacterized protein (TIGR00296 family)